MYVLGTEKIPVQTFGVEVYPNPIQDQLNVSLNLEQNKEVLFEVFNLQGIKIRTLLSKPLTKGKHDLQFDFGNEYSPSLYLLQIIVGEKKEVFKLIK